MAKYLVLTLTFLSYSAMARMPSLKQYDEIKTAALEKNIEPALALAIAETESAFNERAVGGRGELGIFQLMPKIHKNHSIQTGINYLALAKKSCEQRYGNHWFICYNRGINFKKRVRTQEDLYVKRVLKNRKKWVYYEKKKAIFETSLLFTSRQRLGLLCAF